MPKNAKVAKDAFEGAGTNVPTPTPKPITPHYGGGGGGSGPSIPHSRATATQGPDYDLLDLKELAKKQDEVMKDPHESAGVRSKRKNTTSRTTRATMTRTRFEIK